ncbi:MAG: TlpA family protein disulfide reductase [Desulfovibrio sp.]|nr:MAG: TlpA family protein disulfide reductase [Desulfovibrio sp.]
MIPKEISMRYFVKGQFHLACAGLGLAVLLLALCFSASPARAAIPPNLTPLELLQLINEAQGRVVVVNFFASWCTPCAVEIPGLITLRGEFNDDEVLFVGLSVDQDMGDITDFVNKTPFNYPVYVVGDDVATIFKVDSIPRLVIYDQSGRMAVDHEGLVEEDDLRQILDAMLAQ